GGFAFVGGARPIGPGERTRARDQHREGTRGRAQHLLQSRNGRKRGRRCEIGGLRKAIDYGRSQFYRGF
ncbi:hypothetical protein T492DRAFT_1075935, partial [Pavlovales sp. CCMP2436]